MEEATLIQVRAMCTRLINYHWSPLHPSKYVLPADGGLVKGIGLLAHHDYGAFNLTWADVGGKLDTHTDHYTAVTKFTTYQSVSKHTINDVPLSDWLCFMRPKGFYSLVNQSRELPVDLKSRLLQVTAKAISLKELSHD